MGGILTSCKPSLASDDPFFKSRITGKNNFSGGFNLLNHKSQNILSDTKTLTLEDSDEVTTIDINQITEDGLLVLSGITRKLAHSIIEYRRCIGGYKQVEDLAPCIGVFLFNRLKSEFHVSSVNNNNCSGNEEKSFSTYPVSNSLIIDINQATIAQLSRIPDLDDDIARKIVKYRQRNGNYKHINDLIDPACILDLHSFLKVKEFLTTKLKPENCFNSSLITSTESICSDKQKLKVLSWNLNKCCSEKIGNPGVREVTCYKILANRLNIIILFGFISSDVVNLIVDELNFPKLSKLKKIQSNYCKWKSVCQLGKVHQENFAVIWDYSDDISIIKNDALNSHIFYFHLKINEKKINFICINCSSDNQEKEEISFDKVLMTSCLEDTDDIAVFITKDDDIDKDSLAKLDDFSAVFQSNKASDISKENLSGTKLLDNVFNSHSMLQLLSDNCKIFREDLRSPWIPDGWEWNGLAFDRCPLYTEYNLN